MLFVSGKWHVLCGTVDKIIRIWIYFGGASNGAQESSVSSCASRVRVAARRPFVTILTSFLNV